ncbi:MAG: DNA cytosine methyltransferase [Synergistaceae bacterium]|nr:DNA cytosine methyltransferase [Synergistaceae bacterium]
MNRNKVFTCVEICAGAGGQAIGLERAGFRHSVLVEIEPEYCAVLKRNRLNWNVICRDVREFDGREYKGTDLLAGGVPCPPFSSAGKQLGRNDERDLFPEALRLVREIKPRAVMLENVRGFFDRKFDTYRGEILKDMELQGYTVHVRLMDASRFGVPQKRLRAVIVAIRNDQHTLFTYPEGSSETVSVGTALRDLVSAGGWEGADEWAELADSPAPAVVGGSKKHGGADLGPVRARRAWELLGVDGRGVADEAPEPGHAGLIRLTPRMLARLQGFSDDWEFSGKKTAACRMIGNAFPPAVAEAVGRKIRECLIDE